MTGLTGKSTARDNKYPLYVVYSGYLFMLLRFWYVCRQ